MTVRQTQRQSRAWFTPREPDCAVRQWGPSLARSGRRRILDVGCGGGRHAVFLARLGLSVTAGDLSLFALAETRHWLAREGLRGTVLQLEMTALPFPNETFDAVLSVNVLHPARPQQAWMAVGEMWRVLRPGGLFLAVLAGAGDSHCLLERPVAPAQRLLTYPTALEAGAQWRDEGDLHGLFAGFRILGTERHSLDPPEATGPPGRRGVNWRVWAERPVL